VFLAEPPRTQFDLNFQVLGFPVRVHPFFWLVGLLLGFNLMTDGPSLLLWFVAVFVSILIHELGHTLMIRRFGRDAHIVLYGMGGLAIEGRPQGDYRSPWSFESYGGGFNRPRTPQEQVLISAAGPAIQLALAGVVVGLLYIAGGHVSFSAGPIPLPQANLTGELAANRYLALLADFMLYINIFWALVNLLPVLPLDGGQIAMQVLTQQDPWGGMTRALWLSVITAGAFALLALLVLRETYIMILFAILAVSNYLALQQAGGQRPW
jgi:stage IV sporulation protein FB